MKKLLISFAVVMMLVFSSFGQSTNISIVTYKAFTNLFNSMFGIQFNTNFPLTLQTNITVTNITVIGTLTATNINGITTNAVSIATTNNSGILITTNGGSSFNISTNGVGGSGTNVSGATVVQGGTGITSVSNNATNFTVSITSPITTTVSDSALSTNVPRLNVANQHWNGPQLFDNGFSGTGNDVSAVTAHIGTLTVTNGIPDSFLSTNIPRFTSSGIWSGQQTFLNGANTYNGTFNGTVNGTLNVTNGTSFPGGIIQFGSVSLMQPATVQGPIPWFLAGNTNYQNKAQANTDFSTICIDLNPFGSGSAWSIVPCTTNPVYASSGPISTNSDGQVIYEAFDQIGTSFVVTPPDSIAPQDLPGVAQIVRNADTTGGGDPNNNGRFGARFAITSSTIVQGIGGNYAYIMTDPFNGYLHFPLWQGGKWTFDNTNSGAVALDGMLFDHLHGNLSVISNVNVGHFLTVSNKITSVIGASTNSDTTDYFANDDENISIGTGTGFKVFESQTAIPIIGFGVANQWAYTLCPNVGWFPFMSMTIGDNELKSLTNSSKARLEIHGSIATAYRNVATNYTAAFNDDLILISASGVTVTLPLSTGNFGAADAYAGRHVTIKLIVSGSATVAGGGANIDGSSSYSLGSQNKYVTVQTDHTNWWVIANN